MLSTPICQRRQFGDLARGLGRQAQQAAEGLDVRTGRRRIFEVERGHEVTPAQKLPPPGCGSPRPITSDTMACTFAHAGQLGA